MNSYLWKIGGEAGFGIMTIGLSFSKIAARSGYHIYDYSEYPSLIRGGHNTYEVHFSDEPVYATKQHIDLLVCLNKETYEKHKHRLGPDSMVMYDPDEFDFSENYKKIAVPFRKIKKEHEVMQIMLNTVAIGASIGLLGGDLEMFRQIIRDEFSRKGQQVVDFNLKFADIGYDHIKINYSSYIKPRLEKRQLPDQIVAGGNDVFSLAAVAADCRFYAAYPMTPSSSILTTLAAWQDKSGMVVRHAEDEIAVINNALGAAFAGVRSAVGTSGGGFALMVESLSYAGVAEIPIVVFLGMRPGPATGMPTWTDQGDLLFACHAGHGEFPKIVLAAGDIYEMLQLGLESFDLADIYQTPVILLSDKLLSESHLSFSKEMFENTLDRYVPQRGALVQTPQQTPYLRYHDSKDGISERLIPGYNGAFYQANSYEHTEDSHTTEDSAPRVQQVDKRNRKWTTYLAQHFKPPQVFGDIDQSDLCVVSWGSNKGVILDAIKQLSESGMRIAYIHFTHIYPMDPARVTPFFNQKKRYLLIETNSHAQFGSLLQMQTGVVLSEKLLKYDGRPFYPEEIIAYIKKTSNQQ